MLHPCGQGLALALLVFGVRADDHDAAVTSDDTALVTHPLDRGAHLHRSALLLTNDKSIT